MEKGFLIYLGLFLLVSIGCGIYYYKKKNDLKAWLLEHPNAVKVYIKAVSLSGIHTGTLNLHSVDGESPMQFMEGLKSGFYVDPGTHIIESSFSKTRPGIMYKEVTTTIGPTRQEVEIEQGKIYNYFFDAETEEYVLEERK